MTIPRKILDLVIQNYIYGTYLTYLLPEVEENPACRVAVQCIHHLEQSDYI